jgi:hypothetical protein
MSPLRMSPFCVLFLLILVTSLPGDPRLWIVTHVCTLPKQGVLSPKTLVAHIYYSCAGTIAGSCTHNHTTYSVCSRDGQYICFNPIYRPRERWPEAKASAALESSLTTPGLMTPTALCPCTLTCVLQ